MVSLDRRPKGEFAGILLGCMISADCETEEST